MHPFPTPSKHQKAVKFSESRKIFWCFQGAEKEGIGNEWVKIRQF